MTNLAELNEGIILQSLDKKRTYYNSILSDMKPQFKFKKRHRAGQLDDDGNSYRDSDL